MKKIARERPVFTEYKLDEIVARLDHTPQKSVRRRARETGSLSYEAA
jgi:hypothetical protein